MNQHLSILNFLTLGIVVGADELVVTAARSRSNFSTSASWEAREISELWNVTRIATFLADMPPILQCAAHVNMCTLFACRMILICAAASPHFLCHAGRGIAFVSGNATDDCTFHLAYIGLDWQNPSEFRDVAEFVRRKIKQQVTEAPVKPTGQTLQVAVHCLLTSKNIFAQPHPL